MDVTGLKARVPGSALKAQFAKLIARAEKSVAELANEYDALLALVSKEREMSKLAEKIGMTSESNLVELAEEDEAFVQKAAAYLHSLRVFAAGINDADVYILNAAELAACCFMTPTKEEVAKIISEAQSKA